MKTSFSLTGVAASAVLYTLVAAIVAAVACGGAPGAPSTPTPTPGPTATSIPLPVATSATELERNRIVNQAVQLATEGCSGIGLRLSGPPTRVLAANTSLERVPRQLVSQEAKFPALPVVGPGGSGPLTWVVAVEGLGMSVSSEAPQDAAGNIHSFVFVIVDTGVPTFTGCVLQSAPMPTEYGVRFALEVLLDTR